MKKIAALMVLAVCASTAAAHSSVPISWSHDTRSIEQVQTRSLEALDLQQLAAEDAFLEAVGGPPRFAIDHDASESPARSAAWEEAGEYSIWRYRVLAKDAASLNFGFTRYRLPEGAALYIYSGDRQYVAGPYTAAHNKAHGQLWTPIIAAQDVTIELNVPTAVRHQVDLELGKINQGYRGFGTAIEAYRQSELDLAAGGKACSKEGGARSGACNTDVACLSDGDPWNDPRRSVGAYSRSGSFACTGSLVNNTANDRRMLFMTATHCINAGQAPSIVVYWNYEWPTCRRPGAAGGTSTNPPNASITNSGGTWLAATINPFGGGGCSNGSQCSDVTLIELDDPADPDFDLYWSGWDRRPPPTVCAQGTPNTTDGLCASIHHPGVHEKRITFVAQDIQVGNIAAATGVHWHPFWHPNPPELPNMPAGGTLPPSVTEGGSSGSPLYTAQQRFIGVLSGGPAFCGATGASLSDFYGQLAHAWDGIGTPTTRVRDYLDPLAGNPLFIDGLGAAPFGVQVDPTAVAVCANVGSVDFEVDVSLLDPDYSDTVSFDVTGAPTGASTAFVPTSLTPPGSSTLTVGNLGSATAGNYSMTVSVGDGDHEVTRVVPFTLNEAAPDQVVLLTPADNAIGQSLQPTLTWSPGLGGGSVDYLVEVASDAGFGAIVFSEIVSDGTSVVVQPALSSNTDYYWRVTASNACGVAATSAVFQFRTAPAPGTCDDSTTPVAVFEEDFSGGLGGFTTTGSVGASTWAISTARPSPGSGGNAALAVDIPSISDQRLISPPIVLPTGQSPLTLQFWNHQTIELRAAGGCWDGGLLEISTNAGSTWTQVPDSVILNRAYDGAIASGFNNPLIGMQAWCGDPRPWENYIVDIDAYAGQTVQFRWRLGTDSSVGREGWYVDDILVQACELPDDDTIFADGFELP